MLRKFLIPVLFCACFCVANAEDNVALFAAGNHDYQNGNYGAAIDAYDKMTRNGAYSAEAYYNLGSAHQMLNQPVDAVLNYRRALMLNPTLLQARRNLETIEHAKGIPMPRFTWREEITSIILPSSLIYGGVTFAWVGGFLFVLAFLKKGPRFWWISISLVLIIIGKSSAFLGYISDPKLAYRNSAVIMAKESVTARAVPADSSASVTKLLPGTGVSVISKRDAWSYCKLPDNTNAWLPSKNLTMVPSGSGGG
ncbi:MAG: tetratricopeptide repeat protein [Chthoniobacterales bacterium]